MEAKNKIEAVYELREAAQALGRAEQLIEIQRTPQNVDRLLEARERMEHKTMQAIAACQHCGEPHCDDPGHAKKSNVIAVEFVRPDEKEAGT